MTQSVHAAFAATAAQYGDKPFLAVLPETAAAYGIEPGELTYAAALKQVETRAAAWRSAGYAAGHRVGLLLENRPEYFITWFALNSLGLSVVPINPDLRSAELEYLIGHSEVAAVVAIAERHPSIKAAARRNTPVLLPTDIPPPCDTPPTAVNECALLYTSGTTGRPKGCVLSNDYFLEAGRWYSEIGGLIGMQRGVERMLTPLPVFHMNAMAYSTMAMVLTGGCLIVVDRFHPRSWWDTVRQSRATIVHYLGVMPSILMGAAVSLADRDHSVRFGFGAGVPRELHAPFEERFGFPLIEAWAMTETGAGAVIAATEEPRHIGTSCFGRPAPTIETIIVGEDGKALPAGDAGELLVRRAGPETRYGFFIEYLKDAEATALAWDGGWFHTGDVVRQDADGAMHFVDRRKNVIRRSGENIAAVEVEGVLLQHPAIRSAAVAATPDAVRGDEVFACIVPHVSPAAEARAELAHSIVAHCLDRLAYYKAPGWIAFVDALPLTSTQKIQRGELKALVADLAVRPDVIDTRALKRRQSP